MSLARHNPRMKNAVALCLLLLGTLTEAHASSGDYVHWILESPSDSPFAEIRYEVIERGPASAAVHRRRLPGEVRSLHNMGLITRERLNTLHQLISRNSAMTLPDAMQSPVAGPALTWRFEAQLNGAKHGFSVVDPWNQKDRRYWTVFSAVRDLVRSIAAGLPFRDVYYPRSEMGWLNLRSVPPARLSIDGRATELVTPVRELPLRAGKHTILLKSVEGKTVRSYDIRIEAGGTTKLRVELR